MFESGEGGVSGRSGECMSAREDRDCAASRTRRQMDVLMTVAKVNSRFAIDAKALEAMTKLLHGGAQRVMPESGSWR
jgi:hypothetical protein